jgi:hypothetical protein
MVTHLLALGEACRVLITTTEGGFSVNLTHILDLVVYLTFLNLLKSERNIASVLRRVGTTLSVCLPGHQNDCARPGTLTHMSMSQLSLQIVHTQGA